MLYDTGVDNDPKYLERTIFGPIRGPRFFPSLDTGGALLRSDLRLLSETTSR